LYRRGNDECAYSHRFKYNAHHETRHTQHQYLHTVNRLTQFADSDELSHQKHAVSPSGQTDITTPFDGATWQIAVTLSPVPDRAERGCDGP
jgi:hypothetical protein